MYKVTFHTYWGVLDPPLYVSRLAELIEPQIGRIHLPYTFDLEACEAGSGRVSAVTSTGEKGVLEWEETDLEEQWWQEFAGRELQCDTLGKAILFKEWLIREKPATETAADWAAQFMLRQHGLTFERKSSTAQQGFST